MPSRTPLRIDARLSFAHQPDRAHDLTRCAETALQRVMRDERSLQGMQCVAMRHTLDRQDVRTVMTDGQRQTGIHPAAVHQHRARAALPPVAALLAARQMQPLPQQVQQRDPGVIEIDLPWFAIDGQGY